jgi:membrane protease YdiL (CAAX protease family)
LLVSPAFRPNLLVIGLGFGLVAGFFEEIGWTGFAYPRMRQRFGALIGAVILGVAWGCWHLPVVDALGAASPHGPAWPAFFVAFAAALTGLRVLIAWIYDHTESVLLAQLMHASSTGCLVVFGAASVSPAEEALWYALYAAVLWLVAAAVLRAPWALASAAM